MAKKRASMREGPLADLFRSTGESDVAVADSPDADSPDVSAEEIKVERVEQLVEEAPPAEVEEEEAPAPEPEPEPAPDPPPGEVMSEPHKDPAVKDVERRETRALRVNEEARVEHEGLERLMGGSEEEIRPAFGRDEPDTARYATVPRSHQAVLRVVGV